MKHEDRRREAGKMLMELTKYLLTVGVRWSFERKLSVTTGLCLFIIAIVVFIIVFYAIPEKKEVK